MMRYKMQFKWISSALTMAIFWEIMSAEETEIDEWILDARFCVLIIVELFIYKYLTLYI